MKEQTGAGADVGSRLDVRFRLQPVEKDLDRLPDAADVRGRGVLGHQSVVFLPLTRRNERDISLALQMCSPLRVDIGAVRVKASICDQRAVQIDLLCRPQIAETRLADLYGAGDGKPARPQLGKNVQLDAVIPQVFRGISC